MKKTGLRYTALALFLIVSIIGSGALAMTGHGADPHGGMGEHAVTPTDSFVAAENPAYPVGTPVIINTDHMEGMQGAEGVVSGAFETVIYAVDYIDTNTGEAVTNHKWVTHEELEGHRETPYAVGDVVILASGHISSMGGEGAEATIVEVVTGVAYMVDYLPTDGGAEVKDHQWVIESELLPAN